MFLVVSTLYHLHPLIIILPKTLSETSIVGGLGDPIYSTKFIGININHNLCTGNTGTPTNKLSVM